MIARRTHGHTLSPYRRIEPRSISAFAGSVPSSLRGAKASISASRSHTSRNATDCTRPAEAD